MNQSINQPIDRSFAVTDVVLWRRGRADLSALLLAAAVASCILFHGHGASGYTAVSLAADVLLLLLAVLYAWSRAARLLGRPAPPIPDLQPAADELAALIHSCLAGLASAFRRVAQGPGVPLARHRRPARPRRPRPPHPVLRSCGGRSDDPGGVREVEHGEIHEAGVSEPLQIRALVPELLPHLLPQRQRPPHLIELLKEP